MSTPSRRDFLRSGILAGALGASARSASARQDQPAPASRGPELAVLNATVYTVDDRKPKAEAFAIQHGRFVAVGSTEEVRKLLTSSTKIIDADKRTVVPGFIDAHTHPAMAGISELLEVNCDRRTIAEIQAAIRARAEKAAKDEWVLGFKYDDTKLKDGRPLSRADLDEASPNHPVRVVHRGGHTSVCNSFAFRLAGVDAKPPTPKAGSSAATRRAN